MCRLVLFMLNKQAKGREKKSYDSLEQINTLFSEDWSAMVKDGKIAPAALAAVVLNLLAANPLSLCRTQQTLSSSRCLPTLTWKLANATPTQSILAKCSNSLRCRLLLPR